MSQPKKYDPDATEQVAAWVRSDAVEKLRQRAAEESKATGRRVSQGKVIERAITRYCREPVRGEDDESSS